VHAYTQEDLIIESLVLFVVSTTGAGKEPRALAALWASLLRAGLPSDLFEDVQYAVFGLGDTAYERFCWPAKLLDRRLAALGAVPVCARGEGDEQHRLGYVHGSGHLFFVLSTLSALTGHFCHGCARSRQASTSCTRHLRHSRQR
jgi:sulfite reductase alpha subunit-like flavoprotein